MSEKERISYNQQKRKMMEKVVHFIYCLLDPLSTGRASVLNQNSIEDYSICNNLVSIPLNMINIDLKLFQQIINHKGKGNET